MDLETGVAERRGTEHGEQRREGQGKTAHALHVCDGVDGERALTERTLDHLDGYEGAKCVCSPPSTTSAMTVEAV